MGERFRISTFPSSDGEFRAYASTALAEASREQLRQSMTTISEANALIVALQMKLRARYPHAVIHLRDRLAAIASDEPDVLYAYRDGDRVA